MQKETLRQDLKNLLTNLSSDEIAHRSQQIFKSLQTYLSDVAGQHIHVYQSLPDLNEVSTIDIIPWLAQQEAIIFTPTYTQANKPALINETNIVSLNQQLYPHKRSMEPSDKIDTFIIPLLGFDNSGNRLGRGGGFYDILLKFYPDAQKIGLAFESQKTAAIPLETHDVKMHTVITEKVAYTF